MAITNLNDLFYSLSLLNTLKAKNVQLLGISALVRAPYLGLGRDQNPSCQMKVNAEFSGIL